MTRRSMNLTAPMFRHFWPTVPEFPVIHFTPPASKPLTAIRILMHRYLIQGANPIDPEIISKADNNVNRQFQGGYRCSLQLVILPGHGSLRISDDGLSFEYTPNIGYIGGDAFCYRIVNVMGQYSEYGYIQFLVRC